MGENPLNRNGKAFNKSVIWSILIGTKIYYKQFFKNVLSVANSIEYKDSKSFLSVLVLMCRCILYPRSKLFVTSGGKEQAAGIIKEKVDELCALIPALDHELDRRPGRTR